MKLSHIAISLLLGSAILGANDLTPQQLNAQASAAYKSGSFQEALPLYESLNELYPENPEINFLVGRCALELKLYDDAIAAFDRVLILNPQHSRTRLELARLYTEIGQYEMAEDELDTVLSGQLPSNVRETVLTFKSNIDKRKSRSTFGGVVFLGGGYDSNANNDIGNKEFIVPSFNLWINGNDQVKDTNLFTMAVLSYGYDIGDRGGWSVENNLVGYTKINSKEAKNDLSLFSASIAPIWSVQHYRIQFPVTYDRVYLDHQGYTSNLSFSTRGTYLIDTTSQSEGGYTYKRSFYDTQGALDAVSHTLFASYKKAFGENPLILSAGISYTISSEIHPYRTDVASQSTGYSLEFSKALLPKTRGIFSFNGSVTSYDDIDSLFGNRREDSRESWEVKLSHQLRSDLSINGSASYVRNHSNHTPFDYDKKTLQMSAAYSF